MQISDLRFGSLPPLLKNARWVPTAALEDADLSHDIAMVADMVYRVWPLLGRVQSYLSRLRVVQSLNMLTRARLLDWCTGWLRLQGLDQAVAQLA